LTLIQIFENFALEIPKRNGARNKRMKTITNIIYRAFALFAFAWFALAPQARAVVPAPDGGYPNQNTAEGDDALFSLTTGTANTAIGFDALYGNTTGVENTAIGASALYQNTTGGENTATGLNVLTSNTTGGFNTASGFDALATNTTGTDNTASGAYALYSNLDASDNTALGYQALYSNTSNTPLEANTAVGSQALFANTTGWANTATGFYALHSNTIGTRNTASGDYALVNNITGERNVGTGYGALSSNTAGGHNVAYGNAALDASTGNYNTALGYSAGWNLATGNNNIIINNVGVGTESNTIRIGSQVAGVTADGSTQAAHTVTYIAGISGRSAGGSGVAVYINSSGRLGTLVSSARFKQNIQPMDKASEAILALKPVTFRYKQELDPEGIPQFGLVAEDVEKVNPDLLVRDADGLHGSLRSDQRDAAQ
jgi:hypothetical protein